MATNKTPRRKVRARADEFIGKKVIMLDRHPHATEVGIIQSYGPYGPPVFGWKGFLIKDVDSDSSWYARSDDEFRLVIEKTNRKKLRKE